MGTMKNFKNPEEISLPSKKKLF